MNTGLRVFTSIAICSGLILSTGESTLAKTLHNGWNYAIDSFSDGTESRTIGDTSEFEFYGMATRQIGDRYWFVFNSNLSLEGFATSRATNGRVSYSDLFLNFANPNNFDTANGSLYAIRFDRNNDSPVQIGLYNQVTATSVTATNTGYPSLQIYQDAVTEVGGIMTYADDPSNTSYFNQNLPAYTTIASGNSIGDISPITTDFSGLGIDFSQFNTKGQYTFGFSVDQALLPNGGFAAHLFAECGNDGMILRGEKASATEPTTEVPEPMAIAGLALMGFIFQFRQDKSRV
jgi:hypothetical protein